LKITEVAHIFVLFFLSLGYVLILANNGLGYILGHSITNASGHPEFDPKQKQNKNKTKTKQKQNKNKLFSMRKTAMQLRSLRVLPCARRCRSSWLTWRCIKKKNG
jgi:Ran GTPase-activating protein (RanGAP) involved in mRNA processing and transport